MFAVAEDDAALVKHIGQSFRFSAVETKREDQLRSAHDEAMFGASDDRPTIVMDSEIEAENDINDSNETLHDGVDNGDAIKLVERSFCVEVRGRRTAFVGSFILSHPSVKKRHF
ncbi:ATP-dependent RNA helicase DDX46 [Pyrus ussuriensis x Pyrus communis]|uniref:ATP-dependent RNA helicase DDX46 n=1 Tax=Pyrus ussuriensis x Pyrus communis TaxID=2448454 RepID=A0A5N5HZR9_9ROSA|nr:ATP-dependent RNA helicase DDX46 [Pyrus ussuriensis x Pyrus communis]